MEILESQISTKFDFMPYGFGQIKIISVDVRKESSENAVYL
jgi:hypothetical protein